MRTTVTLDPDTDAIVRRLMRERKLTFKQAVNTAIRGGDRDAAPSRFFTRTFDMGEARIDIDKASHFAAQLEDEEIIRKLELRK